jgi:hypothetical protein
VSHVLYCILISVKRTTLLFTRSTIVALIIVAFWVVLAGTDFSAEFTVFDLLSYFTIQTNLLVAITLVIFFLAPRGSRTDSLRGAVVLYSLAVGMIYHVFLSRMGFYVENNWMNILFHTVVPVYMLIDWLVEKPIKQIALRQALTWVLYPLLYVIFVLVRGNISGWYPYQFLNVDVQGYVFLIIAVASLLLIFCLLAIFVARVHALLIKLTPVKS